jgi:hypothetical protein
VSRAPPNYRRRGWRDVDEQLACLFCRHVAETNKLPRRFHCTQFGRIVAPIHACDEFDRHDLGPHERFANRRRSHD